MKAHVWVVETKTNHGTKQVGLFPSRSDARDYADYYNGFSKGKKTATNKVVKYVRVT